MFANEYRSSVIAVGMLLLSSGCAMTPQGMRSDSASARSFDVEQNYQLVLKRIVDARNECHVGPLLPVGQVIFDVSHYPDLREASIVAGASGIGTQIYYVIDIKEILGGKTRVDVYSKMAPDRKVELLKRWISGRTECAV